MLFLVVVGTIYFSSVGLAADADDVGRNGESLGMLLCGVVVTDPRWNAYGKISDTTWDHAVEQGF